MKYTPSQLVDEIQEVAEITCSKCGQESRNWGDAFSASHDFFKLGWRLKNGTVSCPKCAKTKKK